ncbi:MAG: UDP-N-acetylglucosamine 1-carboxyvinyltransferase [Candidatus Levybacteria bacterium GW2011_GWA1_37_16]|nr:MAG: UDP-N-acetylglucosamine 1-carboxyvinyltransferase [Candidatus Levybacteria bacterium GW2011_GWA1_37_16]KKQ41571.1 MAG: UDP-N-acetylglucosamine 1-carboxyvinyltransferase [Candidatus Levybacteria bacterium GW2011_GWB1_37_8]
MGTIGVSGAKNVALKAMVAACLTDQEVIVKNVPLISDFMVMVEIIRELGGVVKIIDHTAHIHMKEFKKEKISLEEAAKIRTSAMFLSPLLARMDKAIIPNPGGCRIGARPIDRTIKGLEKMGYLVSYNSDDGFFYLKKESNFKNKEVVYKFEKSTHTGTETLIMISTLINGARITLENCAAEPEIDELINLLNQMGAKILRTKERTIVIQGVEKLTGTEFTIGPDRNEIVTLAIAAIITKGDVLVKGAQSVDLSPFIQRLELAGGGVEQGEEGVRFFYKGKLTCVDVQTSNYPGFMTDWQGPWAILMTQAKGVAQIHETVYENRFGYVGELKKMGANIDLFNPDIKDPEKIYNFNLSDNNPSYFHAIKIQGPTKLHNGVVEVSDLRAGATLVLAALSAVGESVIFGAEHLDRGYEKLEERLRTLGASIKRVRE